ncbi:MAG: ABC transporter permease [Thermodesulfobacteriota bacterium]
MNLWDIALSSLKRRKAKTALVLTGLTVGVGAMVGMIALSSALTEEINHKMEKYGANIIITPRSERLSLSYEGLTLGDFSFETKELLEEDLVRIRTIKNAANLAAVGPMVLGPVEVEGGRVLLAGINFTSMKVLKPWWHIRGRKPETGELVAGSRAAQVLGLAEGRELLVNGRSLRVSGVLGPNGSQDDGLLFTNLSEAQEILGKPGLVSMVEVAALCSACPVEEMVRQISEVLPGTSVMAIGSVVKGRLETLRMIRRFSLGGSVLVVLVGGLVVLVTMTAGVRERTREIGIFRAVGFRRSHVIRVVLTEAGVTSLGAGVLGWLVGTAGAWLALPHLAESHSAHFQPDPWLALGALFLALTVGLASGAYPALVAAGLDPNEALREL